MSNKQIFFAQNILVDLCTLWELETDCYEYDSVTGNSGTSGETQLLISSGGTKLYILERTAKIGYQWDLSTPWDLSTATVEKSKSFGGTYATYGWWLSEDGTMVFIVRRDTSSGQRSQLERWDLSVAWDISTATYNSISPFLTGNFSNTVAIGSGGTKVYTYVPNDSEIYQHSMGTPYDPTTVTYDTKSWDTGGITTWEQMYLKPDGTKWYTDTGKQVNMNTPYDITTSTIIRTFDPLNSNGGITFRPDGSRFYTINDLTNLIKQYSYLGA